MSRDRMWVFGITGLIVVVAVLGYFLGISPIVAQASAANDQTSSIAAANQASETKIALLKKQFANINELKSQLTSLSGSIPVNADLAVFLRELDALTTQYGVGLTNVGVGDAQSYVAPVVAPPTPAAGTDSSATASPSASPSASSATGTAPVTPAPVGPGARLILIPLKMSVSGPYSNVMAFVGGLQNDARLYLMADLAVKGSLVAGSSGYQADITGFVYALPVAGTSAAGTSGTTATPSPSPSASPSTSASPSASSSASPSSTP